MLFSYYYVLYFFLTLLCMSYVTKENNTYFSLLVIVCLNRRDYSVICNLKLFRSIWEWKLDLFLHYSHSRAAERKRIEEKCDWVFVRLSTQASTVVVVFPSVNRSFTICFLGMLWTLNWNHCCYESCFLFVLVGVHDLFLFPVSFLIHV